MTDKWMAEFARLLPSVESPPSDNAQALGHMMRAWLQAAIVDGGTNVDTGGGMGGYDLWATIGGEELFIQIKSRNKGG